MKSVIISASFSLEAGDPSEIRKRMDANRNDREAKGHYAAPCAGFRF